jgi:hypothetical protein
MRRSNREEENNYWEDHMESSFILEGSGKLATPQSKIDVDCSFGVRFDRERCGKIAGTTAYSATPIGADSGTHVGAQVGSMPGTNEASLAVVT